MDYNSFKARFNVPQPWMYDYYTILWVDKTYEDFGILASANHWQDDIKFFKSGVTMLFLVSKGAVLCDDLKDAVLVEGSPTEPPPEDPDVSETEPS